MHQVNIIVATDLAGGIGKGGTLPWPKIAKDLRRFKELTTGGVVVMGRKTYASIGRPLPNRTNVVLSRDPTFAPPGVAVADQFRHAVLGHARIGQPVWVIGGAEVYAEGLRWADRIYQTVVYAEYDCDVFFPKVQLGAWTLTDDYAPVLPPEHPEEPSYRFLYWKRDYRSAADAP